MNGGEKGMGDFPRVIYNENNDSIESNAKKVENILKEIDNLHGEQLTYNNVLIFENLLYKLTPYVTLIGFEIRPKVIKTKTEHDDEKLLVYYYDGVFINILKLQLMMDNGGLGGYTLTDLVKYKFGAVKDKKCLVYDVDDRYGENVFKINYELSNMEYIIPMCLNDIKLTI